MMRVVLEPPGDSTIFSKIQLKSGQTAKVGRANIADFAFPQSALMSGLHFVIECDENVCRIRDLRSSNGSFINGKRIAEAILRDGDEIVAGQTRFKVRIEKDEAETPPSSQPARMPPLSQPIAPMPVTPLPQSRVTVPLVLVPKQSEVPPVPATPQERLLAMLGGEFQPLYAILDAAAEPDVLKMLYESREERQSLFDGEKGAQLAHFAPYLVRLPQKSPLLEILVRQAWGKSWGVYLTCGLPLQELRTHLRQFLTVRVPKGKRAYFRFYDPRILRAFLPTCLPAEDKQFFGAVTHYLMEDEAPDMLVRFSMTSNGVKRSTFALAPTKPLEMPPAQTGSPPENTPSPLK